MTVDMAEPTNIIDPLSNLVQGFVAQHIVFMVRAQEAIQFSEQPGVNLRGALYQALITRFSPNVPVPGLPYDLIRQFLEGLDDENARGRDLPRAYTVEPPPPNAHYSTGEQFEFGITLFGQAVSYLPYLFYALRDVADLGIGFGRGRFQMIRICEVNPLNKSRRQIIDPHQVSDLRLAINHKAIQYAVNLWRSDEILLRFLTPARLTDYGALARRPSLGILLRRLLERAQSLVEQNQSKPEVAAGLERWKAEWMRMGALGDVLDAQHLIADNTYWKDVTSHSHIKGRSSPIGGLMGKARWQINERDVLYWLLWGQSLHVGKNTAKGDGWYSVE
ncbi:MAG: CRISPR system precrRNA processing endoribonuclease RAMP protein Cas6 [Chloroflexota bacterium]